MSSEAARADPGQALDPDHGRPRGAGVAAEAGGEILQALETAGDERIVHRRRFPVEAQPQAVDVRVELFERGVERADQKLQQETRGVGHVVPDAGRALRELPADAVERAGIAAPQGQKAVGEADEMELDQRAVSTGDPGHDPEPAAAEAHAAGLPEPDRGGDLGLVEPQSLHEGDRSRLALADDVEPEEFSPRDRPFDVAGLHARTDALVVDHDRRHRAPPESAREGSGGRGRRPARHAR